MKYDRKRNQVWDGAGFMLDIQTPAGKNGGPVVGIHDLNPDELIRYRMGRSDMLKVALWFFVNAWRSA